jgi:hypothetical protein
MASLKSRPRVKREPRDFQKQTFWLRSIEGETLNDRGELAAFTPAPNAKAVWVSECRDCGGYFDQALPYHGKFKPDRRCPTCSAVYRLNIAMGLPVKPFPLPKMPRKPPSPAIVRKRAKRKAKREDRRKAKAERARAAARRKKASVKWRRVERSAVVFARRALRMVLGQIKRDARQALAASWRASNAPADTQIPPKPTKAAKRAANASRVAAYRSTQRAAAGLPAPRAYKKRRKAAPSAEQKRAERRAYMRQYRKRSADKKAPRGAEHGEA